MCKLNPSQESHGNRLRRLRSFCFAAQTGSISRAAEQAMLSQPSVSLQIQALELEFKAHSHKRPVVGGPQKEMAEIEARAGKRSELVALGHVVDPGSPPKETWEKRVWQQYDLILVGMNYDADTTLRVLRRNQ